MGMFDSILVNCPICGEEYECQSKSGECSLKVFTLENCPEEEFEDVNGHAPFTCKCGTKFKVGTYQRKVEKL